MRATFWPQLQGFMTYGLGGVVTTTVTVYAAGLYVTVTVSPFSNPSTPYLGG